MKFESFGSRTTSLWFVGTLALAACSSTSSPASPATPVDSAYTAMLREFAICAKQANSCIETAADDTALDGCRDDLAACRETAGEHATNVLAAAVRGCTSEHQACVKAAHGKGAGDCQDDLVLCLGAAHAANGHDDEDAGVDEQGAGKGKGKGKGDCLQDLHACVAAEGAANTCAEKVRSCVNDSMPSPTDMVPASGAPSDGASPTEDSDDDAGVDNAHGKPADPGAKGQAARNAAQQCMIEFAACLDAGSAARSCAMSLQDCRAASK